MRQIQEYKFALKLVLVVIGLWALVPIAFSFFFKELPNEPGAYGDMFGALNALFSGLAFVAIIVTIRFQREEIRESTRTVELQTRAQLLTSIRELARDYKYFQAIETVKRLSDEAAPEEIAKLTPSEQKDLENIVEFLNHAAHLVFSDGLVTVQDVWDSYFVAYEMCGSKLIPHWLEKSRSGHRSRFKAFQDMCVFVAEVPDEQRKKFAANEFERRRNIVERGKRTFE